MDIGIVRDQSGRQVLRPVPRAHLSFVHRYCDEGQGIVQEPYLARGPG